MKKIIIYTIFTLVLLMFINVVNPAKSEADWWNRPAERATQPSTPRDVVLLPTQPPPTQPTSPPPTAAPTIAPTMQPSTAVNQPTATPRIGGEPTVAPTQTPVNGNGGSSTDSNGNACDPGKSYTGPYCGWSPSTSNNGGGTYQARIGGGPRVLGLSNTSGSEVAWSDIIMLAGVLCLALYARSKLIVGNKSV